MNYSSDDFSLELSADFVSLKVVDLASNAVEASYSLSTQTSVGYADGNFVVSTGASCNECFVASFDADNDDQITFAPARMGGVTIVRLDTLKTVYTYDLGHSPVVLVFEDGGLRAKCPMNSSGTGPDPDALEITQVPL